MNDDEREHSAARLAKEAVGITGPEIRPDLSSSGTQPADPQGSAQGRGREPGATGARGGTGEKAAGADVGQEAAPVSELG
jgi:hypothetical protein